MNIERAIWLLRDQVAFQVEALQFDDPAVYEWWAITERILVEAFGAHHRNVNHFGCSVTYGGESDSERQQRHVQTIHEKKGMLRAFIRELELFPPVESVGPSATPRTSPVVASKLDGSNQPTLAPPRAFVSHSTQDRAFVEKFATDLRAKGVDAWYSGWEIRPGDSLRTKIEEGLGGCEYFIIVLSKNSNARPWVQTELDAATVRKIGGKVRKIIPVKIEDCGDLPPTLDALCWEDFSSQPYETALERVLHGIFDVNVRPPLGNPPTAPMRIETAGSKQQVQTLTHPATKFPIHIDDLGRFSDELRSEGFDARKDLLNGQVGLIVGPKGLDPKRTPPDMAGLFFPLWELNYAANRPLIDGRRFHDVVDDRPTDWRSNRPYRHMEGREPMAVRHWNRSAAQLGNGKLEESIREELVRRFPESECPVNINVVGAQNCTYAVVHISNVDAGIDEKPKAIPEDFIDAGGMLAAVVAVTDQILAALRQSGRLPALL